jgi:hypothetical protein
MLFQKQILYYLVYLFYLSISLITNNCINKCINSYSNCNINLTEQCNITCQKGHISYNMKNC